MRLLGLEKTGQTDGQTDGRTVTLRLPLAAASVIKHNDAPCAKSEMIDQTESKRLSSR